MKEFNIEINIDDLGNVSAETKGIQGEICVDELELILKNLDGNRSEKKKPEFYQKATTNHASVYLKGRK